DIDANGILNVSAKDLGTGKEQQVRIEQSSGLSDNEIDKMRKDAEEHASEDKAKRELAELRNQSESMCFQLEKLMKEHDDKLADADKQAVTAAIEKTRGVAKGSDPQAIKAAINELEQASHQMSKTLYEAGAAPGATTADAGATDGSASAGGATSSPDDDAIDAEFEVKDS
ncbi:MAG: Hsp70 family protein, partial [Pirellulales bacterium]